MTMKTLHCLFCYTKRVSWHVSGNVKLELSFGRGGATARFGPPKILKNYFILCISIKELKYLATKIEVGPSKCLS